MTRVLILDDRPINRQFLTTLLTYKSFETREASDGLEGLRMARVWRPDLAIVDIEMPGMDGIEFVHRIHDDPDLASTPIIFYTASYEAADAARMAQECGVRFVLMKPSEPELILATVDDALGRSAVRPRSVLAEAAAAEFVRLHSGALRTSALVEFQLEIAAQRRQEDILNILCRAARNIVASEHSVVTILNEEKAFGVSTSRNEAPVLRNEKSDWSPHCLRHLKWLLSEGRPLRNTGPDDCDECLIRKISVGNCLGVPIGTAKQQYGWLSLMNREGADSYSAEDERIAQTIAAQTAMAYENLLLYEKIREEAELLDRSVTLLRATIEASDNGILVVDNESRFVTYNRRFVEIWRMPDDVLLSGDARRSAQHSATQVKDPEALLAMAAEASAGREVSTTFEMMDGRFIECHAAPRRIGGEMVGRVWSFREVTARVRAEESLRQSEEKYRSLIANIPDVTWTAEAGGNISFVSENIAAMSGFTADEVCAGGRRLWLSRIHPDDLQRVRAAYALLFEHGRSLSVEYRLQRRDGAWIWIDDRSVGTYERNGVTYADGICHDITSRKAAEADLHRVARDRELLLESTGEGIFAIDNSGICTMVNHVAANLFGREPDELIGSPIYELIHHHKADGSPCLSEECAVLVGSRAGIPIRASDEVFWRKEGTSFPVEYLLSPIVDGGVVRGTVVTFSDVTERRRLERRLDQISRVSSLGRMAATIAHEFNNVLMGIQPFAELIRRRAGDDVKLQQYAAHILNAVTRGKNITQDIMRMTRTAEPMLQSVAVSEWIEQLAEEIRALIGGGVIVDVQVPAQELFARCDPVQLQQVVTNVALNARDAMVGRGTLTIAAQASPEGVRLLISDTGCGIPPETVPFIFEPLFTTKQTGTGLGLAVAQQIVISNGGTIVVESSVGLGTRFQIDLPYAPPVAPAPGRDERPAPHAFSVRRVVLVEDDPVVASGLTSVLESADVEVRVVTLGREAAGAVAAFHPDVVIIDIGLPDMSGTAVYEQLATKWPHLGVIFSTGHAEESKLPQPGLKHVGFLSKPYSTETLLTKLREVVADGGQG